MTTPHEDQAMQLLRERLYRGEPMPAQSANARVAAELGLPYSVGGSTTQPTERTTSMRRTSENEAVAIAQARIARAPRAPARPTVAELLPIARGVVALRTAVEAMAAKADDLDREPVGPHPHEEAARQMEKLAAVAPPAHKAAYLKKAAELRAAGERTAGDAQPGPAPLNDKQEACLARLAKQRRSSLEVLTAHITGR